MPELTKQIRLRATDEEKSTLETAAADGGYANVSDYLRHFLFDQHVLIVGDGEHGDLFRLIPAYSSVEAEREAALLNLEGLLQLGEQLKAATALVEVTAEMQAAIEREGLAPTSPEPSFGPDSPRASPVAPAETSPAPEAVEPGSSSPAAGPVPPVQAAPAPVAAVPPPQAPLAAVPEQTVADGLTGPVPAADENFDAFMERRVGELTLTGLSSMRASLEAEAEWRSAVDQAQGATPAAAAVEAVAAAPAAFCSRCGTALGGPFCSSCGTPAA